MIDGLDAYKPKRIRRLVEDEAVAKAATPAARVLMLAILAGAFIAFGGAFYLVVLSGVDPVTGPVRLAGGLAFALGLILVIVGGAELFTGNALMVMACVDRLITPGALLSNWLIVLAGNALGAVLIAFLCHVAGTFQGPAGQVAVSVTEAKLALPVEAAFARGILCNALVCLAVWLGFAARTAAGKVLVILLPVAAFVALGFEHSIANLFLLPIGILSGTQGDVASVLGNLVPVTLGNVVGGAGGVALAYRLAYGPPTDMPA